METEVSAEQVKNTQLLVQVVIDKKVVASATIENIILTTLSMNQSIEYDLNPSGSASCKLVIYTIMSSKAAFKVVAQSAPEEPVVDLGTFEAGLLSITSIKATGLKNTEFVGKPDVFVTISLHDDVIGQFVFIVILVLTCVQVKLRSRMMWV